MHNPSLSTSRTAVWLAIFFGVLIWSVIAPKDLATWFLEVFPALIGFGILAYTFRRFPLTPLVYWFVLAHCLILMVGGHYTYAQVPLFNDLAHLMGGTRNNYDKVGHFAQGFVPVFIARELFIRLQVVKRGWWTHVIATAFCLAISAFYELIEWVVALVSHEAADAFLGTQGYVWDTQSDMAWALFGAIFGLVVLHRYHDRQIEGLQATIGSGGT